MVKKSGTFFLILITALFLLACGIDDVPFLYPIPDGNIRRDLFGTTIFIPENNDVTFTHFAVYYKIYVSDTDSDTPLIMLHTINPTLAQDWDAISRHIDPEIPTNMNMHDLFTGRRFFPLHLQEELINRVLSSSVLGMSVTFSFPLRGTPWMTVGGVNYNLWRSDGHGTFETRPDRYFRNRQELSETIDSTINADVAPRANLAPGARVVTYAAMFIVAVGRNPVTQATLHSTPALINVFRLPDW